MYDHTKVGVRGFVFRGFGGHRDDGRLGRVLVGGDGLFWGGRREAGNKNAGSSRGKMPEDAVIVCMCVCVCLRESERFDIILKKQTD